MKAILFACDIAGTFYGHVDDIIDLTNVLEKIRITEKADKVIFSFITGDSDEEYLEGYIKRITPFLKDTEIIQETHFYAGGIVSEDNQKEYSGRKISKLKKYIEDLKSKDYAINSLFFVDDTSTELANMNEEIPIESYSILAENGIEGICLKLEKLNTQLEEKRKANRISLLLESIREADYVDMQFGNYELQKTYEEKSTAKFLRIENKDEMIYFIEKNNINFLLQKIAEEIISRKLKLEEIFDNDDVSYITDFAMGLVDRIIYANADWDLVEALKGIDKNSYISLVTGLAKPNLIDQGRTRSAKTVLYNLEFEGTLNSKEMWDIYKEPEKYKWLADTVLKRVINLGQYEFYSSELTEKKPMIEEAEDAYMIERAIEKCETYELSNLLGTKINYISDYMIDKLFGGNYVDTDRLDEKINQGKIKIYKAHPTKRKEMKHDEYIDESLPF